MSTIAISPNRIVATLNKASSLVQVLEEIRPLEKTSGKKVVHIPKRVALNERALAAVDSFPALIADAVCPEERRTLTVDEVRSLLVERENLDLIEKVIKERKEAQRVAVFNHHDATLEASGDTSDVDIDKDGFYLVPGGVGVPEYEKGFVRQIQNGSPSLSADALLEQVGIGDFTHEDYLACTTAVRVIDEAKTLIHLRKKPEVVAAIREATSPGKQISKHALGKVQ